MTCSGVRDWLKLGWKASIKAVNLASDAARRPFNPSSCMSDSAISEIKASAVQEIRRHPQETARNSSTSCIYTDLTFVGFFAETQGFPTSWRTVAH